MKMYGALAIAALSMMAATSLTINRYKKQIISLSNIDKLTVVSNRRIFESVLKKAIKNTDKNNFCLAIFDIDNLKRVNDQLGHSKGDEVLKLVSSIAKEHVLKPDIVSRIGGDEFTIIIYKPLNESVNILEKFHFSIQSNSQLKDVNSTISIGITESKADDTEETIFRRADKALYLSKENGRDKLTIKE